MLIHKTNWPALALAVFFNAHASHVWSPLAGNYLGWGDKELLYLAMVATGTRFGRVPRLPLHVGVRTATRTAVFGNSMLQFTPDGVLPPSCTPTSAKSPPKTSPPISRYQRRWIDADAGVNITALLSRATGERLRTMGIQRCSTTRTARRARFISTFARVARRPRPRARAPPRGTLLGRPRGADDVDT